MAQQYAIPSIYVYTQIFILLLRLEKYAYLQPGHDNLLVCNMTDIVQI